MITKPRLSVLGLASSPVDELMFPGSASSREDVLYAVESSEVGYGQTSSIGVRVTRGATVELKFAFRVKAVIATDLASKDVEFEKTLTAAEKDTYSKLKQSYKGGLRVPFLKYIGINLNGYVEKDDMEDASTTVVNYNEKASAAKEIVRTATEQTVLVEGKMFVTGVSSVPTEALVFIKFAQIRTADGETKNVISSNAADLVAATPNGDPNIVNGTQPSLNIIPVGV